MARTVNEIYNSILTEKLKYPSLNNLNSPSLVSIWSTIFYVVAVCIATSEQLRDVFNTNLQKTAATLPTGVNQWYAQTLLLYQDGYNISYDRTTGTVGYSTLDSSSQILTVATCESIDSNVILKTITKDGPLTPTQYQSVSKYIKDFKFAGPIVKLISDPGDLLQLAINVQIDPTIINISGQSISNQSVYSVEDAINNYLLTFQNTNFDSNLKLIKLIDAIESLNGVLNVVVTIANAKTYDGPFYSNILASPLNTYNSNSGWFQIDPSFTLRNNISYLI
jgi:phage baseplate assembly protein gpV